MKPVAAFDLAALVKEARGTADDLCDSFGHPSPISRVLYLCAVALEIMERPLEEIAVEVKLADDLPVETQLSALWTVVRHHSQIAERALHPEQSDLPDPPGAGWQE